jgi:hypothetical protein
MDEMIGYPVDQLPTVRLKSVAVDDEMVARAAEALMRRKVPFRATGIFKEKFMRECVDDARTVLSAALGRDGA